MSQGERVGFGGFFHGIVVLLVGCSGALAAPSEHVRGSTACTEGAEVTLWLSPAEPRPGQSVNVMAVAIDGPVDGIQLAAGDAIDDLSADLRGGPPWSVTATIAEVPSGHYRLYAVRQGTPVSCKSMGPQGDDSQSAPAVWNRRTEAFYSAWIEQLFDAPVDESMSFPSLEPVLRDPARNFLINHYGAGEDNKIPATPDCADLPYFLRAYFAWKTGLPVSYRSCSRGAGNAPPSCGPVTVREDFVGVGAGLGTFKALAVDSNNAVHSGSARTGLEAEQTDLYPVPLKRETLWPGTVYADPYGHTLMIAKWVSQTADKPGLLLAMDAQPDNSVARKRFWEGTFLFAQVPSAGPGFKTFRPLVRRGSHGPFYPLDNDALQATSEFRPYSPEVGALVPEDFYAAMGRLINPDGLDPKQAYEAMLDALVEQLNTRVESVDNGERFMRENPGTVAAMPEGASIFETVGPWEDYSTPSRDMRLIIAMNVLEKLPERLLRYPELFRLEGQKPDEVKAELGRLHVQRIQERKIAYHRTDGSSWELTLADVFARKEAFEVGYNPNDCVEKRWGAQPGTPEYATCRRHAPNTQLARMEEYRPWFREARRPTR